VSPCSLLSSLVRIALHAVGCTGMGLRTSAISSSNICFRCNFHQSSVIHVLSAWTCYFRPRRSFSFSCDQLFFHWMQCSSFWHLCELGSRCTFLIFVVRLESPLLHALDIRGLTGVTTWEFIDFPSRYVEFFINVFGLFRLRRYDTCSLNCLVANCLCLSACLLFVALPHSLGKEMSISLRDMPMLVWLDT